MKKILSYKEYCTGCGLCHSVKNIPFVEDEHGFMQPILSDEDVSFCQKVCPSCDNFNCKDDYSLWGNVIDSYIGWAQDKEIRKSASSGGILTALSCYLLDEGLVDGIIQTTVGDNKPYSTKTVISRTADEVKKCVGSRYSSSSPLYNILQIIKPGERYAFVGKPCDVQTLRLYLECDSNLATQIIYFFSFFCAGIPSTNAQLELLKQLDCVNIEECQRLDYRGNGWPGFATAYKTDGTKKTLSYNDSWGKILGRDVRKMCRFCIDGIGEYADIVCADAWINTTGLPDFSEHEGRNAIFLRNNRGKKVLLGAEEKDYIYIEQNYEYFKNFDQVQKYQNERRSGMRAMLLAMKMMSKNAPKYNNKKLNILEKGAPLKLKIKRFFGTLKRILQKKL